MKFEVSDAVTMPFDFWRKYAGRVMLISGASMQGGDVQGVLVLTESFNFKFKNFLEQEIQIQR